MQGIDLSKTTLMLVLLLTFASARVAVGEDSVPLPEDEAPEALFSTSLGDADVDLFLAGSWNISTSLGGIWGTPSPETPSVPGFSSGFMFNQLPDLTLSLWLMERYFFESTITGDSSFNTYLLGYEGREGELVRRVRLGNTGTAIDSTPLIDPGEHPEGALGASATLETKRSRHELLLRYQRTSRVTRTYAGTSETEEVYLNPADFIRGRYFLLNHEDIENAAVYLEDRNGKLVDGDGRRYTRASDFEAAVSAEQGFVSLSEAPAGRVLIYYEQGGSAPYTADLTVGGIPFLLLYEDGSPSDLEFLAVYPAPNARPGKTVKVELRPSGELEAVAVFTGEYGAGIITLRQGASEKKPLEGLLPQIYPGASGYDPLVPYILLYERVIGTASISVPRNAIQGSVRVTINGRNETRFTRLDDGTLDFPFPVFESDTVEVSYELPDDGASGADLLFVSTNTFQPWKNIPELSLRGDIGVRWNMDSQGYSEEYAEAPGSILAAAGADYQARDWGISVNGGLSVGTHDTRGYLRLGGMNRGTVDFGISGHTLFPAAPSTAFDRADLGEMPYTDYYQYLSTGGSTLREYDWSPPGEQVYDFADGNPIGPSVAKAEDDDIDGIVAVIDYDLDNAEWMGAQISAPGGSLDLSGAAGISFKYRLIGDETALNMTLRAGSVSEDLDGDRNLDEENGPYDSGFAYTHAPTGYTLSVGGGGAGPRGEFGNGTEESEDADGNGLLNRETDTQVLEHSVSLLPAGPWREVYIPLSGTDRAQLAATRAVQILLDAVAVTSGRLLVGELRFHGSSFVPGNSSSETGEVSEYDLEPAETPAVPLYAAYDLVEDRFNDGDEDQKVLRLEWTGTDGAAVGPVPEVPLDSYETLRFYYRLHSPISADLSLTLKGDEGEYRVELADIEQSSSWSEVSVNMKSGKVSVEGGSISSATVSGSTNIIARQATFSIANAGGGVVFLDELHISDPVLSSDLGVLSSARYSKDGDILRVKGLPLFGNFSWSGNSRVASSGFASGFTPADGRVYRVYNEAAFSSLYSRARLSLNIREADTGPQVSGSHTITIPEDGPLQMEDSYTHDPVQEDFSFTKQNSLKLNLNGASAGFTSRAAYNDDTLSQTWKTEAEISPFESFSFSPLLNLTNTLSDPGVDFHSFYGDGWVQGTRLLIYQEELLPTDRSSGLFLPMETRWGDEYSVRILPSAENSRYGTDPRKELDSMGLELNFSGALFPGDFNSLDYSLYYRRDFSGEFSPGDTQKEKGFSTDASSWADTVGDQDYFFSAPPVVEITRDSALGAFRDGTAGFDAADYSPVTGISLERRFSSRLTDLLVPSYLAFEVSRSYERSYDSVTSSLGTDTTARMTAINLFGSLGAYPLFRWYESDQFSSSFQLSTYYDDDLDFSWRYRNEIMLFGPGLTEYALSNNLSFSNDDDRPAWSGSLKATWFQAMAFNFSLPLGGLNMPPADKHLRHRETLDWELSPVEGETWSRTMSVKHATGITFGGQGSIEVYLAFGFRHTPISGSNSDNLTYYALETGVVGEFSF